MLTPPYVLLPPRPPAPPLYRLASSAAFRFSISRCRSRRQSCPALPYPTLPCPAIDPGDGGTHQQVPEQYGDGDLANGRHVDAGALLDVRAKVLLGRKVDAHGALLEQGDWEPVLAVGHARDDHVAARDRVLEGVRHVLHVVHLAADAFAAREALHARHVSTPHVGAVIGQQRGQWPADNLGPVDDRHGAAKEPVAVRQDRVVDAHVLEDLDDGQRRARQQRLLAAGRVQEPAVLVHVEQVAVRQPLDVLLWHR